MATAEERPPRRGSDSPRPKGWRHALSALTRRPMAPGPGGRGLDSAGGRVLPVAAGVPLIDVAPALVALSLAFAGSEAIGAELLQAPMLGACALLTVAFAAMLAILNRLRRNTPASMIAWLFAIGIFAFGITGTIAIADVSPLVAALPVVSFALVLPFTRHPWWLAATAALASFAILVAGLGPHVFPSVGEPIGPLLATGMGLGVTVLALIALSVFAERARAGASSAHKALARQRAIFEGAIDPMFIVDDRRIFVEANPAAATLLGVPRDAIVGRSIGDFYEVPAGDLEETWARFVDAGAGRSRIGIRRPDGELRTVDEASAAYVGANEHLIVWRDVTDEMRALATVEAGHRERGAIARMLRDLHPRDSLEATAQVICESIVQLPGLDLAAIVAFESPERLVVLASSGSPILAGEVIPAERVADLRAHAIDGAWSELVHDRADSAGLRLTRAGIQAEAVGPIETTRGLAGFLIVGTASAAYAPHLLEHLPAVVEFAATARPLLGPGIDERADARAKRREIESLIARRAFHSVFQPVVALDLGHIVGFEALTRFDTGIRPDLVFAAAARVGLGLALERATLESAIAASGALPTGAWLSLNVSPEEACSADLLAMLPLRTQPVVLEVTEHAAIENYEAIRSAIEQMGPDIRVAVDDAGAGVANFAHIVALRPDFLKLDASLVRGMDSDVTRQALVAGLRYFAHATQSYVIAEGIETEAELQALRGLGVLLGQGNLLAPPARADSFPSLQVAPRASPRSHRRRAMLQPVLAATRPPVLGTVPVATWFRVP